MPPSPNDLRELMRLLGDERVSAWLQATSKPRCELPADNNAASGVSFQQQIQSALAYVQVRATEIAAASVALLGAGAVLDEAWDAEMSDDETLQECDLCHHLPVCRRRSRVALLALMPVERFAASNLVVSPRSANP